MGQNEGQFVSEITGLLKKKIKDKNSVRKLSAQLLRGAQGGLELDDSFDVWFSNRFAYQLVWLDKEDYVKALVRALWLAPVFAGTDFGSSRQRDMAQVWTDTARGFLGEIALSKFLADKFRVKTEIDTRRGELTEFLPTDIARIQVSGGEWKTPKLKISIKTTKFNGRWLDLPGAQFEHSDVFVLVKIGVLRQHFLAFLKAISFLKDKLFTAAASLGELSKEDAKKLWDEIPEFDPIPAYTAGYLYKSEVNLPIHKIEFALRGRTNRRITVTQGVGLFSPSALRSLNEIKKVDPQSNLPIEIEPIIKSLTGPRFLAHSGGLKYGESNWRQLIRKL